MREREGGGMETRQGERERGRQRDNGEGSERETLYGSMLYITAK